MRLLRYLKEKYGFSLKVFDNYVEVFENPTTKEVQSLIKSSEFKEVRFSAYSDRKKVYVWDAALSIHLWIDKKVGSEDDWLENVNFLSGNAVLKAGRLTAHRSDHLDFLLSSGEILFLKEILAGNWDWIYRYVDVSYLFNYIKKKIGKK